jgi:hypothetical protein
MSFYLENLFALLMAERELKNYFECFFGFNFKAVAVKIDWIAKYFEQFTFFCRSSQLSNYCLKHFENYFNCLIFFGFAAIYLILIGLIIAFLSFRYCSTYSWLYWFYFQISLNIFYIRLTFIMKIKAKFILRLI